jgi:hypothetical protein
MMLLVPLPWSARPWALPFLTVLAPSQRANEAAGKRHKTTIDWTVQMVKGVGRWPYHLSLFSVIPMNAGIQYVSWIQGDAGDTDVLGMTRVFQK